MSMQVPLLRMSSTILAMTVLATAFLTTKALPQLIAPPTQTPAAGTNFSSTTTSTVTANSTGIITLTGGTVRLEATGGGQVAALLATGANAEITATDVTIVNNNLQGTSFTFGVNATSTPTGVAVVNLLRGSIDVTASGSGRASGINAGVGGTVHASALTLDSTGPNAHAIVAGGGTIDLVGGSITTDGSFALGLQANGNAGPAAIAVDGTTIKTIGPTSSGARAEGTNNATISLTNATIDTEGDNATGLIAIGSGKTITTTNTNIITIGLSASGAAAFNGAQINEAGGTMTTSGSNSIGISSSGLGSTLTAVGLTVTTTGTDSSGALAQEGALLTLQNSSVTTSGIGAVGLEVIPGQTQGSTLIATNSTVSTTGLNGEGILVKGRVPLTVTDVVSLDNTKVTTQQGDGINWDGQSNTNVSLKNGTTVVPGNGVLLRALAGTGSGTPRVLNLTADGNVALEGDVLVGTGSVVNVNLLNNSVLTGAMQNASNVAIETGSRWDITGSSTIGSLTFNGGTLQFNNAFNLGITHLLITLNAFGGTINTNGNDTTLSQAIEGVGGLTKAGAGTLTLSGINTYSGGTSFNGGIIAVNSDANLGTGPLSFNGGTLEALASGSEITSTKAITLAAGGGTFLADTGTTSTLSGVISGIGSFTKDGAGRLTLTGANTYTGGTNLNGGILAVDGSENLGTGALSFNGGTLEELPEGGGTTTSRDIMLGASGGAFMADTGTTSTLSGVISGTGSFTKDGIGTLILTGNNTYSGGTTIEGGTLVAGTPSAAQEVSFALGTGGVFLQGGTLRTSSLETGKPLTINVAGKYTQGPAGTLALGIGGLQGEQYDHVQVGRNSSLNGTLAVSSLNSFRPANGNAFEVLHTNGTRSGQFAQVNDFLNNNPNLQRIDVYAPNGVALVYVAAAPTPTPAPTPPTPVPTPSPTPNPKPPIIDVVPEPLPPINPEEPLPPLLAILDPTAEQLTSLFEISFSGTNTQRFNLEDRLAEIQRGSTGFVSTIPPAAPPSGKETIFQKDGKAVVSQPPVFQPTPENRWGVWVNGWGDFVSVDSDNRAKGYDFTTGGVTIGIDYRITDHLAIGLAGSYAHTWTHLQPAGDVDINTGRGGLYATYFDRGFYVNGGVFGGYNSYDTSRQGLLALATGSTEGYEFSTFLESGYDFHFGNLTVGPVASVQYTNVHVNGFSEQGSLLPLRIHSDSEESWRTDLGMQASYTWHCGSVLLVPSVRAAWEHEFKYSALPITVSSAAFPGVTATFFGPSQGHDSAIINAGLGVQWTPRISTYVGYQGQLGRSNYDANGVTGSISFSF